jgi:four helix bundle protein
MAEQLRRVASFRELLVYQKSRKFCQEVFMLTKQFPKEEMYSLTDQMRRSSRSIGSNLAECWAKRRYEKHFISKLTDADGEQLETQHWIGVAFDCGYLDKATALELRQKCEEIGRLLGGMMEKADQFWDEKALTLREDGVEYTVTSGEEWV